MKFKLIFGVGINDAGYTVNPNNNGKRTNCPYYQVWSSMLRRCYSEKFHKRFPTYIGVTVCDDWLFFSSFRVWMETQNWQGKQLDKDILSPWNRHYSPGTCCFISVKINSLLNDCGASRGKHPIGVSFHKVHKKFHAQCRVNGGIKHLGDYDTAEDASRIYKRFKSKHVKRIANQQLDPRVRQGLLWHAEMILNSQN